MNKIIIVLFLVLLSNLCLAQDLLLNKDEIANITEPTLNALKKFEKRPKRKRRKRRLLKEYNKIVETYPLETILNKQSQSNNDWEQKLNALNIFQYLTENISKTKSASTIIRMNDNKYVIDSLSKEASTSLYNEGKRIIDNLENEFSYMNAYQLLYRANQISPNFENCRKLLNWASASGTKTVSFMPLKPFESVAINTTFDSEKGFNSTPSLYIQMGYDTTFFDSLINDPNLNGTGSQLVNNKNIGADWIVDIQWKSIEAPSRLEEIKISRSKEIEENRVKKTIKAEVTYKKRIVDMRGIMSVKVTSKISDSIIVEREVIGYEKFIYVFVEYSGDKKALTQQDLYYKSQQDQPFKGSLPFVGNKSFSNNQFELNNYNNQSFKHEIITGHLIQKLYESVIYPKLVDELGYLLNWDYPFLRKVNN